MPADALAHLSVYSITSSAEIELPARDQPGLNSLDLDYEKYFYYSFAYLTLPSAEENICATCLLVLPYLLSLRAINNLIFTLYIHFQVLASPPRRSLFQPDFSA